MDIARSSDRATTILYGKVKGIGRRRQETRWEDIVKEWTDMRSGFSLRAAEDRKVEGYGCNGMPHRQSKLSIANSFIKAPHWKKLKEDLHV